MFPPWQDFETVFSIALEQQRETADICVCTSTPCPNSVFGWHVVDHAQLGLVVLCVDVHGFGEEVFFKTKSDGKAGHCVMFSGVSVNSSEAPHDLRTWAEMPAHFEMKLLVVSLKPGTCSSVGHCELRFSQKDSFWSTVLGVSARTCFC